MKHEPTLLACMTPFPYTVEANDTLKFAQEMMLDHEVRHLPVNRDGQLAGVISQREVAVALAVVDGRIAAVEDVAVMPAYVVDCHTPLAAVLRHMARGHYGSALVTRDGRLAGILTTTDVCLALAQILDPPSGPKKAA
ncbi:MAG: acetoin utilization protein AcuB [Myxococcota bacterium]|jgi:acetoin utilization protein AcuB